MTKTGAFLLSRINTFAAAALVAVLVVGVQVAREDPRHPVFDEIVYLDAANNLVHHGVLAKGPIAATPPVPSMVEAPVTPAFLAALMSVDETLRDTVACIMAANYDPARPTTDCPPVYGAYLWVMTLLAGLAAGVVWLIARATGAGPGVCWLALILALASGQYGYFARHFLTDGYVLGFFSLMVLGLVSALRPGDGRTRTLAALALAGAAIGFCALTREGYWPLGLATGVALLVFGRRSFGLAGGAVFLGAFAVVLAPWLIRNALLFDTFGLVDGRGATVLIQRIAYNAMTWTEWAAAWVFWLPDFGDRLGPALFGADAVERLKWFGEQSFYQVGNGALQDEVRAAANAAGVTPVAYVLDTYVFGDIARHTAVSAVLSWRGLWIGNYFGLIGHVAGIAGAIILIRRGQSGALLALTVPALVMVALHGWVSVSIPRYNVGMVPYLAVLTAIALGAGAARFRSRFFRARNGA
ncbi:MAG: hypothetical protein RIC16_17470 [Rhodospirillales bacterium]